MRPTFTGGRASPLRPMMPGVTPSLVRMLLRFSSNRSTVTESRSRNMRTSAAMLYDSFFSHVTSGLPVDCSYLPGKAGLLTEPFDEPKKYPSSGVPFQGP